MVLCRCAGGAPLRASLVYRRGATRMLDHANPPAGGAMAVYRKRISWLVVAIAALFSLPASATLMPMSDASFSWTADSSTGFDWLDFDGGPALSAVGRSWDDVSAQLGSGGDYEGWDFATRAQVNGFVLAATGVPFSASGYSTAYQGITDLVAGYTGYTRQSSILDYVYGLTKDVADTNQHYFNPSLPT